MHPVQKRNKENPSYRTQILKDGKVIDVYADPHYGKKCIVCGQKPCVQLRGIDTDKIEYITDMCGPCTFGEADCIDPAEW
jgi:hypothetical protein